MCESGHDERARSRSLLDYRVQSGRFFESYLQTVLYSRGLAPLISFSSRRVGRPHRK